MHYEVVLILIFTEKIILQIICFPFFKSHLLNFCAFYGFQGAGVSLPGVQLLMKIGKTQGAF